MHYAVIAAGAGSRLQHEGVAHPKPLVPIGGQPMIDRLMRLMLAHRAESLSIVINDRMPDVRRHLEAWGTPAHLASLGLPADFPFHLVVQTTPSSMHSLAALAPVLPADRFCLTTVDTIFRDDDFGRYIRTFEALRPDQADGCFGVTPYVDDEKPLYVTPTPDGDYIADFCDTRPEGPWYVSGGIYGLDARTALPVLHRCLEAGQSRMRNYQRALIAAGLRLRLSVFPRILDVDHAEDIAQAEQMVAYHRAADNC